MRFFSTAACAAVAVALIAGCSGNVSQPTPSGPSTMDNASHVTPLKRHNPKPVWAFPANLYDNSNGVEPGFQRTLRVVQTGKKNSGGPMPKGIYVNQFYGTGPMAYQNRNTGDNAPFCTVPTGIGADVNGIAFDAAGTLMVPVPVNYSGLPVLEIWQGPQAGSACGSMVSSISDPYGQPSNAASYDALNGEIVLANIFGPSGTAGSLSICTVSGGCTQNLTNYTTMFKVAGVALASNGDCWASAENPSGVATLTYFAGCAGGGVQATGFMNVDYGSLSFDKNGNLVSVDKNPSGISQLWVYNGCNPACSLVGGPFPLSGECGSGTSVCTSVYGIPNKQSMTLAVGTRTTGSVDVYYYSPTSLTYWYSFTNGLSASGLIEGLGYNPPSLDP